MCIFATKQIRAVNISRTKKRIAKDISLSQFAVKRAISDLRKKKAMLKPSSAIEPKTAIVHCNSRSRVIPLIPRGNSCHLVIWGGITFD